MKLNKKLIAVPAIALAAGISLAACGSSGSSSAGSGSAPQNTAPASVVRISQNSVNQEGGLAPVLHYTNFYSDGHSTSCTGMPDQITGSYEWMGDCVPDGK